MKRIRFALVALILCFSLVYMGGEEVWAAAKKHYGRSCVDNSCAAGYDLSDVTGMTDGDTAVVPADPTYEGPLHYLWDEDSGLTESLPDVKDADIGGNGRWILQKLPIPAGGTGAATAPTARTALGVAIGTDVQAHDDNLDDFVGAVYTCNDDTCFSGGNIPLATTGYKINMDDNDETGCPGARNEINAMSGLTNGKIYTYTFEDNCWMVDFTGTNFYGHNGIDWNPVEGDRMECEAISATVVYCTVSRPTALDISMYYDMPFDSTPDSNDR